MRICIDWGNSRVKVAIFKEDGFLNNAYNYSHEEAPKNIIELVAKHEINKGILCSVAGIHSELESLFAQESFLIFNQDTPIPIINAYQTPETLGLDRLVAVIGAQNEHPNSNHLVISIGTALVFNFLTKNNIFRGGAISPGIHLRMRALHDHTHALPLVEMGSYNPLIGYDTASSIRSGCINGVAHEIDGAIANYHEQFKNLRVTITGGDISLLEKKIKSRIFADSLIILKGLNHILNYNAK